MYQHYFGFLCAPFEDDIHEKFSYLSKTHEETAAALLYFWREKKHFALVCGDVGTGKTMLINNFIRSLPGSVQPILITNPYIGYAEILQHIGRMLHLESSGHDVLELTTQIKEGLVQLESLNRPCDLLLIIDEAHLLSDQALEDVRLLSNIVVNGRRLLQILLVGQYELSHSLNRPEMRQLRQRISVNRFLSPLEPSETIEYIDHRLRVAGSSFKACFEPSCKKTLFKLSGGVPRSINHLCDSALLICMVKNMQIVTPKILKEAYAALNSDRKFTALPGESRALSWRRWASSLVVGFCLLLCLSVIALGGAAFWRKDIGQTLWRATSSEILPQEPSRIVVPIETKNQDKTPIAIVADQKESPPTPVAAESRPIALANEPERASQGERPQEAKVESVPAPVQKPAVPVRVSPKQTISKALSSSTIKTDPKRKPSGKTKVRAQRLSRQKSESRKAKLKVNQEGMR